MKFIIFLTLAAAYQRNTEITALCRFADGITTNYAEVKKHPTKDSLYALPIVPAYQKYFKQTEINASKTLTADWFAQPDTAIQGRLVDIEPYNGASKLNAYVTFYDLEAQNCNVHYKLMDSTNVILKEDDWTVDAPTMAVWGTDDMVLIQGLANAIGVTIIY